MCTTPTTWRSPTHLLLEASGVGTCVISYQLVARAPKDLPCPLRSPRSSEVSLGPGETSKT